ncbi:T9SS type A sorting domain-containing protein, partial [Bacteroidales bacterium AH-315-I05]|nr:T9SS type A sorting domain-containing protein [Bacteroidales bacterium AH-315-I05]
AAGDALGHASSGLPGTITNPNEMPVLKVLPIEENDKYGYYLVYEIIVKTETPSIPGKYYTLVDANTGDVLYRQNRVHTTAPAPPAVDVTLAGTVTDNVLLTPQMQMLPNAKLIAGGTTYYTDANGFVSITGSGPLTTNFYMEGLYADVVMYQGNTASFSGSLSTGSNSISFDNDADATEITAYFHTNMIHDHMKAWTPAGYTSMDSPMDVTVEISTDNCNAFYDGGLNFYAAGGGCPSTSLFDDVIYHEYAHGINYNLYNFYGGSFGNGALGEGYSDVWAFTLTLNPILAQGFQGGSNTSIRRYDLAPKVYPQDLVGEVHADGEIIAGAWWDLNVNLGSMNTMMDMYIGTHPAVLSEPDGQEGKLFRDILLEALTYDDNDGDITNGTPNGLDIVDAFAKHGITLLSDAEIQHTPVDVAIADASITIDGTLIVSGMGAAYLGDVKLFYRTDKSSPWSEVIMTTTNSTDYTAVIPSQPAGTIVSYYMGAEDIFGNLASVKPAGAQDANPNLPFYILVSFEEKATEDFDFNNMGAWKEGVAGDDAVTGMWEINLPMGTFVTPGNPSTMVEPDHQHTTGGQLFAVTQASLSTTEGIGERDVDDGLTTLESPIFDLSGYTEPAFTYYRWYSNNTGANPGNDWWQVHISNDGGNTWTAAEVTNVADASWRRYAFKVSDYVTPTNNVMLHFYASDSLHLGQGLQFDGGSLVEGALDDVVLWDLAGTSSIDEANDAFAVNIYPNPAVRYFNLSLELEVEDNLEIEVLNQLGEIVLVETYPSVASGYNRLMIATDGLASGVYTVKATVGQKRVVKKLTVVK